MRLCYGCTRRTARGAPPVCAPGCPSARRWSATCSRMPACRWKWRTAQSSCRIGRIRSSACWCAEGAPGSSDRLATLRVEEVQPVEVDRELRLLPRLERRPPLEPRGQRLADAGVEVDDELRAERLDSVDG